MVLAVKPPANFAVKTTSIDPATDTKLHTTYSHSCFSLHPRACLIDEIAVSLTKEGSLCERAFAINKAPLPSSPTVDKYMTTMVYQGSP